MYATSRLRTDSGEHERRNGSECQKLTKKSILLIFRVQVKEFVLIFH